MNGTWTTEAEDVTWLRVDVALASAARREAAALGRRIGMSEARVSDLELAVTEAATNLRQHARDGAIALRLVRSRTQVAVEFLALDNGPGIDDLTGALTDGVSTAGTLGVGLGAIARLADGFDIHSLPGRGTALTARFAASAGAVGEGSDAGERGGIGDAAVPAPRTGGLTRPISGERVCGDTWAAREYALPDARDGGAGRPGDGVVVMMCDGLGHGPMAARVGERARQVFREDTASEPEKVLRALHSGLRGTRGAAVAVARFDPATRRVRLCGAGNVSAFVLTATTRHALLSMPGIVGHQLPALRTFEAELPPGAVLVLHSDGLSDRWVPHDYPGLLTREPTLIAGQLLWQAGIRRDDAGVVVVKAGP